MAAVFENTSTLSGRPDERQRPRHHDRETFWSSAVAVDERACGKPVRRLPNPSVSTKLKTGGNRKPYGGRVQTQNPPLKLTRDEGTSTKSLVTVGRATQGMAPLSALCAVLGPKEPLLIVSARVGSRIRLLNRMVGASRSLQATVEAPTLMAHALKKAR